MRNYILRGVFVAEATLVTVGIMRACRLRNLHLYICTITIINIEVIEVEGVTLARSSSLGVTREGRRWGKLFRRRDKLPTRVRREGREDDGGRAVVEGIRVMILILIGRWDGL